MKLRKHICTAALLGVALAFISVGTTAVAQGLQPPFMAPTPPSLNYGVFYFQAGVKYRNVDTFRFDVIGAPNTIVVNPGTVPFGPTTSGDFGVAIGRPGFDGTSGTATPNGSFSWIYDNGQISGDVIPGGGVLVAPDILDPALPNTCVNPTPPPPDVLCNVDYLWTYSVVQPVIGRFITTVSGSCCSGNASVSEGSFVVDDPTTQVNNLGSMVSTTQVTYQLSLADSLAFVTNTTPDINRVVDSNVWGPTFEMGYQFSNYFDLFYGFSWFNVSNSIALSNTIQGQGARQTIVDTFPFISDDTAGWPVSLGAFQSSSSVNLGSSQFQNYHLATNSPLRGVYPNRQFSSQLDATIPSENIQETITNTSEFTPLENRFGARSWAPLYGLGRLGATLGTAVIPTYYKISGSSSYIAAGPPNGAVAPGTVLAAQSAEHTNWKPSYGLFVGGDLSMGNTGYFLYASADYMWATTITYELGAVKTSFNPGGFTGALNAGLQF